MTNLSLDSLNLDPLAARWPLAIGGRMLRGVALAWIGYFAALAALDRAFVLAQPQVAALPFSYYGLQAGIALLTLALTGSDRVRLMLGRGFLPIVLLCMAALPPLVAPLFLRGLPPGPMTSAEGLGLRLLPVLWMGLVLVAWHYRWPQVAGYSLATAGLAVALIGLRDGMVGLRLSPGVIVTCIQTMSFLIVGACICALMSRLRAQGAALEAANGRLRHYAATLEELTLSRERNRVARELHDTLAHTLSGLAVQLETIKAYAEVDAATAGALIDTAAETARSGLQETRLALKALRASPLSQGLIPALDQLARRAAERSRLRLDLDLDGHMPALAPDIEQAIYRVAQEAIANAGHHANARALLVRLRAEPDRVRLEVGDDGIGFDQRQAAPGHFGLPGMRERAALAGGYLRISSAPGAGTRVELLIDRE
jgi:signal transduction histidine kinase